MRPVGSAYAVLVMAAPPRRLAYSREQLRVSGSLKDRGDESPPPLPYAIWTWGCPNGRLSVSATDRRPHAEVTGGLLPDIAPSAFTKPSRDGRPSERPMKPGQRSKRRGWGRWRQEIPR